MTENSQKRALLLIDVQNEYVSGALPIEYPPLEVSLPNIGRAISIARAHGIPIIAVKQVSPESSPIFAEGSHGAELLADIDEAGADLVVSKTLPSALFGTNLKEWLVRNDLKTIVVAGYMSQNCVESTIRHAAHEGFVVEYLHDASGTVSFKNKLGTLSARAMHEATSIVLQSRFAAVLTTDEWVDLVNHGVAAKRESIIDSLNSMDIGSEA